MKINITTIVLGVALGAVLLLLGKIAWTNHSLSSITDQLNEELMEANLEVGRAKTRFGDAGDSISNLEKQLQNEIKARNAEITRYGELRARYDAIAAKKPVKDTKIVYIEETPIECPSNTFVRGLLYEAITEKTLMALHEYTGRLEDFRLSIDCTISPVPNRNRFIPMSVGYQLHQKFGGQLVETRTPSGAINHYVQLFELDNEGNKIGDLKLDSWTVVVADELAPKWFWWAPHLDIMGHVAAGPGDWFYTGGSMGISLMGYGRTENDLSSRVLRLSLDFGDDIGIGFSPVLYNLGEKLPLISNLWIGPHITKGIKHEWLLGIVLGAQL